MRIADATIEIESVDRQYADQGYPDRLCLGGSIDRQRVSDRRPVKIVAPEIVVSNLDCAVRTEAPAATNRVRRIVAVDLGVVQARNVVARHLQVPAADARAEIEGGLCARWREHRLLSRGSQRTKRCHHGEDAKGLF